MFQMSSHDPFGHLKHKLWPKEGLGVKLIIWLQTTKSRKLPIIFCLQVVRDIPLKSSQWGLQLCFISIRGFHAKLWTPKVVRIPTRRILGLPRQNDIWGLVLWPTIKYTMRGKVVPSPKSRPWWVLWVRVCPWWILAPKVFQLCTNQLVVLCRSVWVSDCLSFFLVPSQSSSTPLYPQSATNQETCPNFLLFHYFHLRLTFESIKELGSASQVMFQMMICFHVHLQ
jgi:hypothetical protein